MAVAVKNKKLGKGKKEAESKRHELSSRDFHESSAHSRRFPWKKVVIWFVVTAFLFGLDYYLLKTYSASSNSFLKLELGDFGERFKFALIGVLISGLIGYYVVGSEWAKKNLPIIMILSSLAIFVIFGWLSTLGIALGLIIRKKV